MNNDKKMQENDYITPRKASYNFNFNDVILNNNNMNNQ